MEHEYIWALRALMLILIMIWGLYLALTELRKRQEKATATPASPSGEKAPVAAKATDRPPGVWHPSPFKRPRALAYPDWSVETTKPLPYRPFRYGPKYNINMGLRPMAWDEWIELDNHFPKFHAAKSKRIAERSKRCCKTAPEAWPAAVELLEELTAYLAERYPSLYVPLEGGKEGVRNVLTGDVVDLGEVREAGRNGEDLMQQAARLVQDDLAIMIEGSDGQYRLLAGAILLAGFWRLEDKFGMPLSEIHTSGDVPQFKEKLERGMLSFFRRLAPEKPMLRNNYFIQVDDDLAWSPSIGSEDIAELEGWKAAEWDRAIEHHWFRSERQSLRRLPKTGAIVFTIRTYFHPIVDVAQELYVPGRLASAVRSWGDDVSRYKGKERYQKVLLAYLDKMHDEQIANGLDMSKEEEVRAYPY